jgi:hypothetical protein
MLNCEILNHIPTWVYVIIGIFFIYLLYKFFNSNTCDEQNYNELFTENPSNLKVYNFNTKWCHWSNHFRPEWDKFMETVKQIKKTNPNFNVIAIDVDCEDSNNQELINKYNIPGYPYILIESKDGKTYEYDNERTSETLLKTVKEMLSNVN